MGQTCWIAKEAWSLLTQLTDTLIALITNLYVWTGLVGIIVAMAIESACIPLPSEIIMPLAGIMFASGKLLPGMNFVVGLVLIALAGSVGSLIGSIVAYGVGYSGGRPLMLKYGRYLLISQHDADKADAFFRRWGSATAFFSRLLPVVRTYISLPAGIARMSFGKFCIYTLLGSFPWCLLLAYVGTVIGGNLGTLSPIFRSLDIVILIVLVALVALYIWRHIHNDRKARAELAASQVAVVPVASTPQQGWGQPSQPLSQFQNGNQPSQQAWNQPQPQQAQSLVAQSGWNQPQQPPQTPQQQFQPQPLPTWNQSQPPSQQSWGQTPQQPQQPQLQQPWPPQGGDNDRTVRRG
jgi:membrane protein DedA with SNARE-associated domain